MPHIRIATKFYKLAMSILLTFFLVVSLQAQEKVLEVTGPTDSSGFIGFVDYYLDETTNLGINDVVSSQYAGEFKAVDSEFIDFGFTKSMIWLKISLKNATQDDDRFMLFFRENFFPNFNAYQTGPDGEIITITEQAEGDGFDSRPIDYPFLIVPVKVKAGSTSDVYVRYSSGGSSEVRFTIETEDSFNAIANATVFKNSIFYGMLALMFMVAAAVFLFSLNPVFFAYGASTLTTLFLIMHLDGTGFQYIWSSWPQFNSNASLYLCLISIFFGSMFGRAFLQTKRYHKYVDKVFLALMSISVLVLFGSSFMDTQTLKWLAVLLFPITHLWYMIAGLNAARTRFKEVRFYVLAWTGVFIGSLGLMAREIIGIEMTEVAVWDTLRVVSVADAAFMGLGLLDRYNQIRISSQESMKASLKQARRNLKLTQRLNDLEKQFETVSHIAQSKDQQISNTVHDLRQPLHALRLKVHDIMQGNNEDNKSFEDVTQNFGYLESLISDHLSEAAEGAEIIGASDGLAIRDESEDDDNRTTLSTGAILTSVYEMFLPDAEEKGLALEYTATDHEIDVDSLVLMRIASNLVSNAVKYTQEGKVSFGVVKQDGKLRFEIHDTGVGMSSDEFAAALAHNVRLKEGADQAEGNGFGLSIIKDLAEKHDLKLSLSPEHSQGTGIFVDFPAKLA